MSSTGGPNSGNGWTCRGVVNLTIPMRTLPRSVDASPGSAGLVTVFQSANALRAKPPVVISVQEVAADPEEVLDDTVDRR